ncbi:MAG TPA: iron-containing alcohol dehydrogenase [Steroidobacter sp.]
MSEVPACMWRDAVISSFQCPTKIVFGIGAHEALADVVRERAAKRLLVLLDPALVSSAIHRKVAGILAQRDVATIVLTASDSTVQAALESRRQQGADGLLAIGGDSTIEVAKAVGRLMPSLPLIAIPTTAAAGSAVSSACSISILDPLTVSAMPAHDAAYAGIDAFVHAFESYLSKRATVFSDAVNLQAMTLIAGSIRALVADRNNASAALDVLCGSSLAAMSFGVTGLGNVSCMASSVGALFPVPRGLANAVCLPHVAAFNVSASPERYARIAAILGIDGIGRREAQGGAQAIHGLRALCSDLGIPSRLRDVGVTEDRLDEMARLSFANDSHSSNPRETSEQDFRDLFRAAF